jgi:hypothetical protein
MSKKEFENNCFSPNWLEIDTSYKVENADTRVNMEVRQESSRRKDLNTLLNEVDEIKQTIERVAEKQHRLANLMGFYTGEIAQ